MKSKKIILVAGLVVVLGLLTLYTVTSTNVPSVKVQQPDNEIAPGHIPADERKSSDNYTVTIKKAQTAAVWYDDYGTMHEDVMLA